MCRQHHVCAIALLTLGLGLLIGCACHHCDRFAGIFLSLRWMLFDSEKIRHNLVHACVYITRTCKE